MRASGWRLQLEAHEVKAILVDPESQAPLFDVLLKDTTAWEKVSQSPHDALFVLLPPDARPLGADADEPRGQAHGE